MLGEKKGEGMRGEIEFVEEGGYLYSKFLRP
jgi:hypothetical protein